MAFVPKLNKKKTNDIKVDDKALNLAISHIQNGSPYKIACRAANFSYSQFKFMVKQGELDIDGKVKSIYADFVNKLRSIESAEIGRLREKIVESEKGHNGAQWWLARKHWKYFSDRAEIIQLAEEMEEFKDQVAKKDNG